MLPFSVKEERRLKCLVTSIALQTNQEIILSRQEEKMWELCNYFLLLSVFTQFTQFLFFLDSLCFSPFAEECYSTMLVVLETSLSRKLILGELLPPCSLAFPQRVFYCMSHTSKKDAKDPKEDRRPGIKLFQDELILQVQYFSIYRFIFNCITWTPRHLGNDHLLSIINSFLQC